MKQGKSTLSLHLRNDNCYEVIAEFSAWSSMIFKIAYALDRIEVRSDVTSRRASTHVLQNRENVRSLR